MKPFITALALALLAAVGAGSYWLGTRTHSGDGATATTTAAASAPVARKLLYYRNPMGLADTSPTPKKDPMGMDYVAVYQGEDEPATGGNAGAPGQLRISTDKIQRLGVRSEAAAMRMLGKTVRAAGRVEADERRVATVTAKFEGYVERLHVNATGQAVTKGQALFEAYSPELVAAQREYAIAVQGIAAMKDAGAEAQASMKQLAESSLTRLRNWDLSSTHIGALMSTGQAQRTLTFASPVSGIVTEKKALAGMRFMPGEMLYQVTDLSALWVVADLSEQDIAGARVGAKARITTTAYPNDVFEGRITYVYPTMKAETRTIAVRVELANPGGLLKPGMFAMVELAVGGKTPVLSVSDSAVIDTGTRRMVLVQLDGGRFEPREVEVGARGENYIEIVKGLKAGEQVVVAANFLIDAESNLKAAIGGMGAAAAATSTPLAAAATVGHRGEGSVDEIDLQGATLTLAHGPVPSLKWPAMTMAFKLANPGLLTSIKRGQSVRFEFVERAPGEYLITALSAAPTPPATAPAAPPATPARAASHSGH